MNERENESLNNNRFNFLNYGGWTQQSSNTFAHMCTKFVPEGFEPLTFWFAGGGVTTI